MEPPFNLTPDFARFHFDTMGEARQSGAQRSGPGPLAPTILQAQAGNEDPYTYTDGEPSLTGDQAKSDPKATYAKPKGPTRWRAEEELRLLELRDENPDASWEEIRVEFSADGKCEPRTRDALEKRHHDLWKRDESIDKLKQKIAVAAPLLQMSTTQMHSGTPWDIRDDVRLFDIKSKYADLPWWQIRAKFNKWSQELRTRDEVEARYLELWQNGETVNSLRQKAADSGMEESKRQHWSQDEDRLLMELRGNEMLWKDISKRLPGRSEHGCLARFNKLSGTSQNAG